MNYSLEYLLTIQSFVLWIKDECSPREKEYWDEWLSEHPSHQQIVRKAEEIVVAVHGEHEIPDPQSELQKLNQELSRQKISSSGLRKSYPKRSVWWQYTGTVAAGFIFVIAVLGGIFAYQYGPAKKASAEEIAISKMTTNKLYTTDYGEKMTIKLSDGSSIMLNAHSTLRFSSIIEKGPNTQVWLQGEAYFDIAHMEGDRQRTFTVYTGDGAIQVLGTQFAVNTFGEGTETALERGKISIRIEGKNDRGASSTEYELTPGEMAQFSTTDNKIMVKEADMRLYTSWTEDKLIFAQAPMQEVARRIERTFGVEVIISQKYKDEHVTGTIRSDDLDVLTQALEKILRAEIHQEGKRLQIGTADKSSDSKEMK